ncbi:MAG: alkaline phosphatase family protein [Hellea sp.]|nr:alkaline phosphatase family protein [Hellea sp.]
MRYVKTISLAAILIGACSVVVTTGEDSIGSTQKASSMTMTSAALDMSSPLSSLAFGSCLKEKDDQSIWNTISAENPDAFVFLGDNVYGDLYPDDPRFNLPEMPAMKASYEKLADSRAFANFRAKTPLFVAWDDHDYGVNDGGAEYPFKDRAKELFLDAWDIPTDDARRKRAGVYTSEMIGPAGQTVQLILLDTRYFRGPLTETDEKNAPLKERYLQNFDPSSTMLGDDQWAWLDGELKKPADLRILVSSIQVIAEGHGWEAWRTLPLQRQKLYDLLKDNGASNTIIISGDRHSGAFYERSDVTGARLLEMTTSSLNAPVSVWRARSGETRIEPGPYRDGDPQMEVNYGMMDIDWTKRQAKLRLVSPGLETRTKIFDF